MTMPVVTKKNSLTISWVNGVQLTVEVRKHRIVVDQPLEEGGQEGGMTPVEMFVGSLGACIGYFAVRFCQRHNIAAAGLKVTMEWDYADRPHRVGSMTAHVNLPGMLDPAMRDRLQKVLEGCTVHQSILIAPKISIHLSTPKAGERLT